MRIASQPRAGRAYELPPFTLGKQKTKKKENKKQGLGGAIADSRTIAGRRDTQAGAVDKLFTPS